MPATPADPNGPPTNGYQVPGATGPADGYPTPPPPPYGWPQNYYPGQPSDPYSRNPGGWSQAGVPAWGGGGPPGLPPAGGWNYGWSSNQPDRTRRSLPTAVTALLLAVAVLVGLGIGHGVWRTQASVSTGTVAPNGGLTNPAGNGSGSGSNGSGSGGSSSINSGSIAAAVDPGLVDIDTTLVDGAAAGTGIVLSSDGYVLTNNHVISGATSIKATDIGNSETYTARVVGYDRTQDVAVIRLVGASGLKVAKLGNSDKVSIGDAVVGIGNAGGTGGVPSTAPGQVTALKQQITAQDQSNGTSEQLSGLIQTDADIQPGDSGGALVNTSAAVVGMDTAASQSFSIQSAANQGFAIPINTADAIAGSIRSGTSTSAIHLGATAFLGVEVDVSPNGGTPGASIQGVLANGPAATAGLTGGDVITDLGGSAVTSANSLTDLISHYHPGDRVQLTWIDASGQSHQATVTLSTGPAA